MLLFLPLTASHTPPKIMRISILLGAEIRVISLNLTLSARLPFIWILAISPFLFVLTTFLYLENEGNELQSWYLLLEAEHLENWSKNSL